MVTVFTTTLTVLYRKSDISLEDKTYINKYWILKIRRIYLLDIRLSSMDIVKQNALSIFKK